MAGQQIQPWRCDGGCSDFSGTTDTVCAQVRNGLSARPPEATGH